MGTLFPENHMKNLFDYLRRIDMPVRQRINDVYNTMTNISFLQCDSYIQNADYNLGYPTSAMKTC